MPAQYCAVAEDEEGGDWELVAESATVATDANANDLVPRPARAAEAAVDGPPISPFAAAQPAVDAQVRHPADACRLGVAGC